MRIGVDARILTEKTTGIGNYLYHILKELSVLDKENEYFLYMFQEGCVVFDNPRWKKRIASRYFPTSMAWMLTQGAGMVLKDRVDVLWAPWPTVPFFLPTKIVVTVHDFVWRHYPESVGATYSFLCKVMTTPSISRADVVFSVSEATQNDVRRFYPGKKDLRVTYNSVDPIYKPCDKVFARKYLSDKFGLRKPFLFDVATLEPKKNLPTLFRAFKKLKVDHGIEHQLVIAGGKGWKDSLIYQTYAELDFQSDEVVFLGYVENEDLKMLYNAADVFVFPSLWEGFGIPPLEAMNCGCPVVVSNIPALTEVVGDCGLKADPFDHEKIADLIKKFLDSPSLRNEFILKGLERSKKFSWSQSARVVLDTFNRIYEK